MEIVDGKLRIDKEGKVKKLVNAVTRFRSPACAATQQQDVTYVTERCVMKLTTDGIVVTEIAPGVELQSNILDQSEFWLVVSPTLKQMDRTLFMPEKMGLKLHA